MIDGVLVTNGAKDGTPGYHAPSAWALATAQRIARTDDLSQAAEEFQPGAGEKLIEAERLRMKFVDILVKHHTRVRDNEAAAVKGDPDNRPLRMVRHDLKEDEEVINDAMAAAHECCEAARGTMWEAKYQQDSVMAEVAGTIAHDMRSVRRIEHHRHYDNNPHLKKPQSAADVPLVELTMGA